MGDHDIELEGLPRAYRASGAWLYFLVATSVLFAGIGTFGLGYQLLRSSGEFGSRLLLGGLSLCSLGLGLYALLSTLRSRVVLYANRIEVFELTTSRVLYRRDIRGWRYLPTSPSTYVLEPRREGDKRLKFVCCFQTDATLNAWVWTLPSLEAEDDRQFKRQVRKNTQLGATPGERMRTLEHGRRSERWVTVCAWALAAWGFFFPRPYDLVVFVLVLAPWIAVDIVRRSNGVFRLDAPRGSKQPTSSVLILLPACVLGMRALFDFNTPYSLLLLLYGVIAGGALFIFALAADRGLRHKLESLFLALFLFGYGCATTTIANARLDYSEGSNYEVPVRTKYISTGKRTEYRLVLEPWGPDRYTNDLDVGKATYDAIHKGDVVDMTLMDGALGLKWYYLRQWRRGRQ